jgi:hypothetical protein
LNQQTQQNMQQGAIVIEWEGPQPGREELAPRVIQSSLRYLQTLQRNGDISTYRPFVNITNPGGIVVIEGQVDRLVDLTKDPDYRQWLLTCQTALARFEVIIALGGTNGEVDVVMAQQEEASRLLVEAQRGGTRSQGEFSSQSQGQGQGRRAFSLT